MPETRAITIMSHQIKLFTCPSYKKIRRTYFFNKNKFVIRKFQYFFAILYNILTKNKLPNPFFKISKMWDKRKKTHRKGSMTLWQQGHKFVQSESR